MHKLFTVCTEQVRSPYTEHAASGLPNPTHLEGAVRFDQAQDQQVVTTRSPRIVTVCLLTRSMLIKMYVYAPQEKYNCYFFFFFFFFVDPIHRISILPVFLVRDYFYLTYRSFLSFYFYFVPSTDKISKISRKSLNKKNAGLIHILAETAANLLALVPDTRLLHKRRYP